MTLAWIAAVFILLAATRFEPVDASCCCCPCCCCCCKPCCCCCCKCCCCPCCCCCCKPCCCCCCKPCCCCCCKPCCCCCGGRRRRSLAAAAARGALGNASLVPRAEAVGSRSARSCGGKCEECKNSPAAGGCQAGGCQAGPANRQCRQCTPAEEKACLAMVQQQQQHKEAPATGSHSYRKFKRAIAAQKSQPGCANQADNKQCKC
uniref:Secreted protein n=1 Tax=Bursaphelenchus xylophilus TaxID=6326 RepID=A0A1I7S275_BURXY